MRSQFRGLDSGFISGGGGTALPRADKLAGMANAAATAAGQAQQSADFAMKAAVAVVKLLPEIEKHTRRTANKAGTI
jgi:hypothetical protein